MRKVVSKERRGLAGRNPDAAPHDIVLVEVEEVDCLIGVVLIDFAAVGARQCPAASPNEDFVPQAEMLVEIIWIFPAVASSEYDDHELSPPIHGERYSPSGGVRVS